MITTERDVFLGAHTTIDVKEALEVEARIAASAEGETRPSVSKITHRILAKALRERGHEIDEVDE